MSETAIGVIGAGGRMGQTLIQTIARSENCRLAGGSESEGHPALGRDLGLLAGIEAQEQTLSDDVAALIAASDVLIEFTSPSATVRHVAQSSAAGKAHVIGTTGLDNAQQQALNEATGRAALVQAPNMSLGVNLLMALVERVSASLDADYDIEVLEMHHHHKIDAPSGTALGLGKAAAAGRGVELDSVSNRGRDGLTGARKRGDIGFAVLRGGDVIGDHSVIFAAEGERLELTHKASSRAIYARGAVRAARWLKGKAPGLYSMNDVLGL